MAHQVEVDACIAHLASHSEHYFNVVKQKRQDGVLWAVFAVVRPKINTEGARVRVAVKRASFLPLTTVLNTNAPSLIQMFNTCDHTRQFVCWFTLESADGEPVLSKVMCIDQEAQYDATDASRGQPHRHHSTVAPAGSPGRAETPGRGGAGGAALNRTRSLVQRQHEADQQRQQPGGRDGGGGAATTTPARQTTAAPGGSPPGAGGATPAIDELRQDMQSFEAQQQSQRSASTSVGEAVATKTRKANEYLQALQASQRAGGAGGSPGRRGSQPGFVQQQSFQQILRVSMQVADSVSELGVAIDDVRSQVVSLETAFTTAPKPPPADVFAAVLNRLDTIERRQQQMEQRVEAFDDIQKRFFEQVSQLRDQINAAPAGGGGSPGGGGGGRGSGTFAEPAGSERLADLQTQEQSIRRKIEEPISYQTLVASKARRDAAAIAGVSLPREPGRQSPTADDIASRIRIEPPEVHSEGSSSDDDGEGAARAQQAPHGTAPASATSSRASSPAPSRTGARTTPPVTNAGGAITSRRASPAPSTGAGGGGGGGGGGFLTAGTGAAPAAVASSSRRGSSHADAAAGGAAAGGGGGGDDESLTDMIRSMERKLSRIPADRRRSS